jgi:hypothetical protein
MQTDTLYEQPLLRIPSCVCQDVCNLTDLSLLYPSTKGKVYLNAVYSRVFGMCQRLII